MQVRYAFGADLGAVLWESIGHAESEKQWVTVTSLLVQHQGGLPLNFVVCRGSQLLALDMVFAGLLETSVYGQHSLSPWLRRSYRREEMPTLIEDVMKHRVVWVDEREDGESVVVTFAGPHLEALKSGSVCMEVNRVLDAVAASVGKETAVIVQPQVSYCPSTGSEDMAMVERYRHATVQALHALENLSLGEAYSVVNGSIRKPVLWLSRTPHNEELYRVREKLRLRAARLDLRAEKPEDFVTIE